MVWTTFHNMIRFSNSMLINYNYSHPLVLIMNNYDIIMSMKQENISSYLIFQVYHTRVSVLTKSNDHHSLSVLNFRI